MLIKKYIHKRIDREKIKKLDTTVYFLPDDYDYPCFCIYVPTDNYESDERAVAYYIEVLFDENELIQSVVRYKDELAYTNHETKRFPRIIEENAELILKSIVS